MPIFLGHRPRPWTPLGGHTEPPPPQPPQLVLPYFSPFAWASPLRSEGLPRFLLISVLMPVKGVAITNVSLQFNQPLLSSSLICAQ